MESEKKLEKILGDISPILKEGLNDKLNYNAHNYDKKKDTRQRPYELSSAPSYTDISPPSD